MNQRKEAYERKRNELEEKCILCRKQQNSSLERCNYGCTTGRKIRMLEAEYADVTGWSHKMWNKGI